MALFHPTRGMRYNKSMQSRRVVLFLVLIVCLPVISVAATCPPTAPDQLGPFYKPDTPLRDRVGTGYILTGVVRSAQNCAAIPGAMIELWMAGPDGEYADEYRATIIAGKSGSFRFQSHIPPAYFGRPPHIHIRATASGFRTLVTQHYPAANSRDAVFDLVLIPDRND